MSYLYIKTNYKWDECKKPFVTIVTGTYNRAKTIRRTIESVYNQTFKDFEYIIVDDGSEDETEQIVLEELSQNRIPMMYVKKKNGGVHTARNLGIQNGRGEMYLGIDSDDELLPSAIEVFECEWRKLQNKDEFFEIKARCVDQNGKEVGPRFDDDINLISWEKARKQYQKMICEQIGFRRMDVLKSNLFPEPEGVTFVSEDLLWYKLRNMYKSYFINDVVRVYHTEGDEHLGFGVKKKRKDLQKVYNSYWDTVFRLNHANIFVNTLQQLINVSVRYVVMKNILKRRHYHGKNEVIKSKLSRVFIGFIYFPALIFSFYYESRHCKYE